MPMAQYDRAAAVEYARKWALSRNPAYYDYDGLGGDCTNFVSQCVYAGSGVMNYKPTFGWYYINANNHSPSWTGVPYLYNFLTRNTGAGPAGAKTDILNVVPGDISQFADENMNYYHSQLIVSVGHPAALNNILVCAHTDDSLNRPLSTYSFSRIRFVHITGVSK